MTSRRSATNRSGRCEAQVLNRQRRFKIDSGEVGSLCATVLEALGQPPCRLTVMFVGPRTMRSLNRTWRGKDSPTDVLSFPYGRERVEDAVFLGEVVIAPAIAHENARLWDVQPEEEMRRLVVHGILHLLGYDHETDRGRMLRLQSRLLKSSGQ